MRFIICGAGAIGGVIGGQLAKAGREVIFIEKIRSMLLLSKHMACNCAGCMAITHCGFP